MSTGSIDLDLAVRPHAQTRLDYSFAQKSLKLQDLGFRYPTHPGIGL